METQLGGKGSRCDEVRSAERRQEVVNCRFVCQVDSCQAQTPLVTVVVKQVIVADAGVKQMARPNARRISVGVVGPGRGEVEQLGSKRGLSRANRRCQWCGRSGRMVPAVEADGRLLVRIERSERGWKVGHQGRTGHQPAVIAPVESDQATLKVLISAR